MKIFATASTLIIVVLSLIFYYFTMKDTTFLSVGVYDPGFDYAQNTKITLENVYVSWDDDPKNIKQTVEDVLAKNRTPILTIEPWQELRATPAAKKLLLDISFAKYDKTIKATCTTLAEVKGEIIIRWGHEMELKNDRYPWSNGDPTEYKNAYKRFADACRTKSTTFKFMWSPAGDDGTEKYYPGDSYVDYIGLSLYSFEEWEIKNIGYHRSFDEIIEGKYNHVKAFNKPIIIAEMGITGDDNSQKKWMNAFANAVAKYPLITGVVYFNSKDVEGVWGKDISTPNWHISEKAIKPLLDISNTNK